MVQTNLTNRVKNQGSGINTKEKNAIKLLPPRGPLKKKKEKGHGRRNTRLKAKILRTACVMRGRDKPGTIK